MKRSFKTLPAALATLAVWSPPVLAHAGHETHAAMKKQGAGSLRPPAFRFAAA